MIIAITGIIAGLVLIMRPLDALAVLAVAAPGVVVFAIAWWLYRHPLKSKWTPLIGGLLALVVSGLAFVNLEVLSPALRFVLPTLLAISIVLLVQHKQWIWAISSALFAWSLLWWPDITLILSAYIFPLSLIFFGLRFICKKFRPEAVRVPKWLLGLASIVVLAIGGAGVVATEITRAALPGVDTLYSWDADIPAPGTLLRVADYEGNLPEGAHAQRILYATTRGDDQPVVASAVVALPEQPADTVLAWQHGTTGVTQLCAPSLLDNALSELAIPGINQAIERGWAVVATDYPGQGTDGPYPYLIGEGEGRATLDAVRAAQQLEGVSSGAAALLWGHSQGGHATLFADQIAANYAPELQIRGVAALSAAADPKLMADTIMGADASALGSVISSFVLVPYAENYSDVELSDYVHRAGVGLIQAYADRCVNDKSMLASVLSAVLIGDNPPLVSIDLQDSAAAHRLTENVASGAGSAPLFLGQGEADEVLPFQSQVEMAQRARAQGRDLVEKSYPGYAHMGVIAADSPLIADLFRWVDSLE